LTDTLRAKLTIISTCRCTTITHS